MSVKGDKGLKFDFHRRSKMTRQERVKRYVEILNIWGGK